MGSLEKGPRNLESLEGGPEHESQEAYSSRIKLEFFRHGAKEKAPGKPDEAIELSEIGKAGAMQRASGETKIDQAVAFGSDRYDHAMKTNPAHFFGR